jgi:hypothetical protein
MQIRSPRTILAISAAVALSAAAFAPTAAFAKGPGPGAGDCTGDCTADQPQAGQQVRAQDGSGDGARQRVRAQDGSGADSNQTATKASAGGGGQVQARAGDSSGSQTRAGGGRNAAQNSGQVQGRAQNAKDGAGNGPNEDGERGPGSCDECDVEMGELTEEQMAGVVFMANEEKLAHDVYAAFAELYDLPIFGNIAESEARHQEAVNVVLERYGIENPVVDLPAGEFSDPIVASLYDQLIEQGSVSLEEALAVGVLIEETDIADLEVRIADLEVGPDGLEQTAPDVHAMYSHLLQGSQNHLEAFSARG